VPIGRPVTQAELNNHLTSLAQAAFHTSHEIDMVEQWWNTLTLPGDLTALGYTAGEATQVQSMMTNLLLWNNLLKGDATMGVAQNLRGPIRRALGTGRF
jgi:hypothetical protein